MAKIEFNDRAFKKVVNDAVKDRARDSQRMMDRLARELKGAPLSTAKSRLKREWQRHGGKISDPELTELAQRLVDGDKTEFKVGRLL